MANLNKLEKELHDVGQSLHLTPYVALAKVKTVLKNHDIHVDDLETFIRMDAISEPFFFPLIFPAKNQPEEPVYLTLEYDKTSDGYFAVTINIVTDEELRE